MSNETNKKRLGNEAQPFGARDATRSRGALIADFTFARPGELIRFCTWSNSFPTQP
jgi:hypothetical protein